MVEIRRRKGQSMDDSSHRSSSAVRRRNNKRATNPTSPFKACLQFLFMSSIIPMMFFLRVKKKEGNSFLRSPLSIPEALPGPFSFLPDLLRTYWTEESRGNGYGSRLDQKYLGSDIVELHHCRGAFTGNQMNWGNFTSWAEPLVNATIKQLAVKSKDVTQEIVLELLEMYATHNQYCNFDHYRPSVEKDSLALEQTQLIDPPSGQARLAYVIAMQQDIAQVELLVQAIHMPHHYIIIHLQSKAPPEWKESLMKLSTDYDNVVIVKFGTVLPEADSISMIHLRLMRWLTREIGLKYDYHITLDETSFPLYSAKALAQHLDMSPHSVWLGALTEQGKPSKSLSFLDLLAEKQVIVGTAIQRSVPLGRIFRGDWLPQFLARERAVDTKSTPGKFAVFSNEIVNRLLDSSEVMELFAVSKYCFGRPPIENYNWLRALKLIDSDEEALSLQQEARSATSMFQLWGGTDGNCDNALAAQQNGVLTSDGSLCYRIEHPRLVKAIYNETDTGDLSIPGNRLTIKGDKIMLYLKHAKRLDFLFARPFNSSNTKSLALQDAIRASWF